MGRMSCFKIEECSNFTNFIENIDIEASDLTLIIYLLYKYLTSITQWDDMRIVVYENGVVKCEWWLIPWSSLQNVEWSQRTEVVPAVVLSQAESRSTKTLSDTSYCSL